MLLKFASLQNITRPANGLGVKFDLALHSHRKLRDGKKTAEEGVWTQMGLQRQAGHPTTYVPGIGLQSSTLTAVKGLQGEI